MKLIELLPDAANIDAALSIEKLVLDSRQVAKGDAFIALAGSRQHGMHYARQALASGASVVIYDPEGCTEALLQGLSPTKLIAVEQLAEKLGEIAARYYARPSERLTMIGVTGTNGKTSCTQFLAQALPDGVVIGTLGWGSYGHLAETLNTTPDALAVQTMLSAFVGQKKKYVAMEVSSHGLQQGRVNAVAFDAVVYTNISRDHLDYHGSMQAYLQAKLKLLATPGLKTAVINIDDGYAGQIMAAVPESVDIWGFSLKGRKQAHINCVSVEKIHYGAGGTQFEVMWAGETVMLETALYGDFNLENLLAVLTVLLALGYTLPDSAKRVVAVQPVTGRMQRFGGDGQPVVFVDYAHTPDALKNVLVSVKKYVSQALWVVFGCGGDRDVGKRAEMGRIAEQWADHVVLTNDNPRTEAADAIINDILTGCCGQKVEVIKDREQAIQRTILQAEANDWVVIAGKGHEQYQEIGQEKLPFSDQQVVMQALADRRIEHGHVA